MSRNRFGGKARIACVVGLSLLGMVIAVQAGLVPLSFNPFVSVSLGPPNCQDGVDCSEGALDLTAGDFNNDGKLDIATANNASDDITLLLGDGQGGLSYGSTLGAVAGPSGIASGRLNADANIDLVVAKEFSESGPQGMMKIGVFIGHGDGTFEPEVEYDMGGAPQAVVLADFNNDRKLDVATADLFSDTVSVRLGNGDGTLGELHQTAVAGGPFGMAAGLLDDDDNTDLAVSLYDESKLATLIGQGDGTFLFAGTAAAADLDDAPRGVALADFNYDGKLDAAVATESFDTVDVLLGNGDGTFQPLTPYTVGGVPESVVARDLNGDGIIDIASADNFGTVDLDGDVSVLLGNCDGTFQDAQQFETDIGPFGLVASNLIENQLPDLVTANIDNTNVSVLVNTGPPLCVGDCDGSRKVSVNELVLGVNIALGSAPLCNCATFNENGNGVVDVAELVRGVNNALLNLCQTEG